MVVLKCLFTDAVFVMFPWRLRRDQERSGGPCAGGVARPDVPTLGGQREATMPSRCGDGVVAPIASGSLWYENARERVAVSILEGMELSRGHVHLPFVHADDGSCRELMAELEGGDLAVHADTHRRVDLLVESHVPASAVDIDLDVGIEARSGDELLHDELLPRWDHEFIHPSGLDGLPSLRQGLNNVNHTVRESRLSSQHEGGRRESLVHGKGG